MRKFLLSASSLLVAVLLSFSAELLFAQSPDNQEVIHREIERLEKQQQDIAERLAILKAKLPEDKRPETTVKEEPEEKVYGSVAEIFQDLPPELQPKRGIGWDKYDFIKVHEWLSREPIGVPFSTTLKITLVKVGRNPHAYSNNNLPRYRADIRFESRDWKLPGVVLTQVVGKDWPLGLHLTGDENFARRMEQIKVGHQVTVSGKINKIYLGPETKGKRLAHVGLTEYEVKSALIPGEEQ